MRVKTIFNVVSSKTSESIYGLAFTKSAILRYYAEQYFKA